MEFLIDLIDHIDNGNRAGLPPSPMPPPSRLRVALAGAVHSHIKTFRRILERRPEVTVAAVWDADAERARDLAEEFGGRRADDLSSILTEPGIDAVLVYSETVRHRAIIEAVTAAGKPLFVEKPLAVSGADITACHRAITDSKVLFQAGYHLRADPAVRLVRKLALERAFGTITRIHCQLGHSAALDRRLAGPYEWMTRPDEAGGGAFLDMGTHALDRMLWIGQPRRALRATAVYHPGVGAYASGCEEVGHGLIAFDDGCIGSLVASWADPGNPIAVLVSGTEGYACVSDDGLRIRSEHIAGADGSAWQGPMPEPWPHALEAFFDRLLGRETIPLVGVDEAARTAIVMEAMLEAERTGSWTVPDYGNLQER